MSDEADEEYFDSMNQEIAILRDRAVVAEKQLADLARLAKALVEALPKCQHCTAPATRTHGKGTPFGPFVGWCDVHSIDPVAPDLFKRPNEYIKASALYELQALLEERTLDGAAGGEASADEKGGGG